MNGRHSRRPSSLSVDCRPPCVLRRNSVEPLSVRVRTVCRWTTPGGPRRRDDSGRRGARGPDKAPPRAVARFANPWLTFHLVRGGRCYRVRGGADAVARTGGTHAAAGRGSAATVVPRRGPSRGDPMSFEDDEYWESEYDDNPKRRP